MQERIEELERENQLLREDLKEIQQLSKKRTKRRLGILKFIGGAVAGKKLKRSIYNILSEYNAKKDISKENFSDFLASLIQRITRIGVVTIMFAVLPSVLLMRQNYLLKQQNHKIQDQTHLAEASRRSAQMFIMGEVLSDINKELDYEKRRTLSNTLTGRVISLSRSMKPYRYIKGNQLIKDPISPERGQLLITLSKSNLEKSYFIDLLQESDFTQAELTDSNLYSATLQDINLYKSNLSNSSLVNANLSFAHLEKVNFKNVDFTDANLSGAYLNGANLNYADLSHANLTNADLRDVSLDSAKVDKSDWLDYLKTAKVKGVENIVNTYKVDSVYFESTNEKLLALVKK